MDLGISSEQLEISGRGFTFQKDEPLLMTMKQNLTPRDLTAQIIVIFRLDGGQKPTLQSYSLVSWRHIRSYRLCACVISPGLPVQFAAPVPD